jgi:hypothetical protein
MVLEVLPYDQLVELKPHNIVGAQGTAKLFISWPGSKREKEAGAPIHWHVHSNLKTSHQDPPLELEN